jgi:DNA-binding transcriptional LysR family regulator
MLTRNFRRLDLTTLQLFLAICEEGTLTRAARRQAIAPSAASKRLLELEETLGVELFVREARGMVRTPAGNTLWHHARQMIFKAEQIAVELAEHAKGVRGYVRMLANLSAIVQFLPSDLHSFLARQDMIKVDLEERPSVDVVKGVEDGWAELGVCASGIPTGELRSMPYRRDRLVVVMRPENPLARRQVVSFAETLDQDHVGLHIASSIYTTLRIEAQRTGQPLRVRVHVPGFDAVCRMVQANMGIGVVPELVCKLLAPQMDVVGVPLSDEWAHRELQIVSRPQSLSPAADLLLRHLTASTDDVAIR